MFVDWLHLEGGGSKPGVPWRTNMAGVAVHKLSVRPEDYSALLLWRSAFAFGRSEIVTYGRLFRRRPPASKSRSRARAARAESAFPSLSARLSRREHEPIYGSGE